VQFDWSESKNLENHRKHGVSFEEAQGLFESGVDYLEIFDADHSEDEDRFIAIGAIHRGVLVVVRTDRGDDVVRIISARLATRRETELFRSRMGDLL